MARLSLAGPPSAVREAIDRDVGWHEVPEQIRAIVLPDRRRLHLKLRRKGMVKTKHGNRKK